jgi:hypothetical protein
MLLLASRRARDRPVPDGMMAVLPAPWPQSGAGFEGRYHTRFHTHGEGLDLHDCIDDFIDCA